MNRKRIFKWIKIILIIYCLVGIALYYLQDRILFHPVALNRDHEYDFNIPFKELNIPYTETSNINVIQFQSSTDTLKGVVLYFHGNKKNISWYAAYPPEFTKHGYEVWMIDYPGYGKSTGKFTEQMLYDWALQLYKLARARFTRDSIIIYGKSMGTGIAAQLASVRDCKGLILETPYYSLPSLVSNYFPIYPVKRMINYKIPTWEFLQSVTAPVTIFHGTNDWIVPYRNAKRLMPYLKTGDQFITIQNGSHNSLHGTPLFRQKLDSILSK